MSEELIIGLQPGNARDGVAAVLVSFRDGSMDILHATKSSFPIAIKQTLGQLPETDQFRYEELSRLLDETLGRFFARVAQNLVREAGMEMRDIRAIGSPGLNVCHQPGGNRPVTVQLGKAQLIAKNTGTTVVSDFCHADLEAGGEGAPLAPLLHRCLFHSDTENRAVLNVGGTASLTLLPRNGEIAGIDCGPGNILSDIWTRRHLRKDFDHNGLWASKGQADPDLLTRLLADPYFHECSPGCAQAEYFNIDWLDAYLADSDLAPGCVQTTLVEFTAHCVARGIKGFPSTDRLLVCGGGARNSYLVRRIAAALPDVIVEPTTRHGADPDWVNGLVFAWLARERLNGRVQDTRAITGAANPVMLGNIHPS